MKSSEVRQLLGQPEAVQDFVMPEAPFFGPQEALTQLVPAGTAVLEWQYERGDDVLYLWFTAAEDSASDWALVAWFEAPADAVY